MSIESVMPSYHLNDYIDWFSNIESALLSYSKPHLIILNIFMYNSSICYISILCICLHVAPFSSCPQSFPASGSFPVSWLFESGGQSIGASASASVLPMNIQGWFSFRIDWFISWLSRGLSSLCPISFLYCFSISVCIYFCSRYFIPFCCVWYILFFFLIF